MTLILNHRKLGTGFGGKTFLGVQQQSRINHDIPGSGCLRNQRTRCQLKVGSVLRTVDVHDGATLAIDPIGVVVLVVLGKTITPLGNPNNTSDQVVKREFCIGRTLLTLLSDLLNLFDEKALICGRNLGTLAFRQVDVVCLDVRIGKPVGNRCVDWSSIQLRWTQEEIHRVVNGIGLNTCLNTVALCILEIQNGKELLHRTQAKLNLDLAILQSNQRQRRSDVFTEPEMKRDYNLTTANRGFGSH